MKLGLIGNGGREHAIARALARRGGKDSLDVFASHPNPGIERVARLVGYGDLDDAQSVVNFFHANQVELVVIGPEVALMAGAVDALRAAGILAVGPTRSQARLESDKTFMRDLLRRRVGWGSPLWRACTNRADAAEFIQQVGQVAVKPLGLTSGKGVKVMGVHLMSAEEALDYAEEWIKHDGQVLLEERLVGEEFSRMAFVCDGRLLPMPVAQDFKYAYDGNTGPMTGGMGVYTTANGSMPFLLPAELAEADRLMQDVVRALTEETGQDYRGMLYGQFMITGHGIRVIEFNARFGDPEGINLMALLESDPPDLFEKVAAGEAQPGEARFQSRASVVKYLVPQKYPQEAPKPVFELDEKVITRAGFDLIFASVKQTGSRWQALGSRTLALVGLGDTPEQIGAAMEDLLARVEPPELRHRRDVGSAADIAEKVRRMEALRLGGML